MGNPVEKLDESNHDDSNDALDLLESLLEDDGGNDVNRNDSTVASPGVNSLFENKDKVKNSSIIHSGDTDSSDDEDNRYFENQKYNECGKNIKKILSIREYGEKLSLFPSDNVPRREEASWKKKLPATPTSKPTLAAKPLISKKDLDVYTDPIFGMRIINPLITSKHLQEKMIGRKAVPLSLVKQHISNGGAESDWVIAGVIVQKSPIKTSQKGSQYCIWKLSDLKGDLKTVSLFLFRNSHKNLWKTSVGTVVGVLNPSVLDDSKGKDGDLACLSIDNAQKVMILGISKDYGICKAKKKNGEDCTAFVNMNKCTYCIYHVKQEYKKCSGRAELQSPSLGRGLNALRNKVLGKNEIFYAGQSFSAIPATVSRKQAARDNKTLDMLYQSKLPESFIISEKGNQMQGERDGKILGALSGRGAPGMNEPSKAVPLHESSLRLNARPQLSQSAEIDLSTPVNKFHIDRAKLTALQWVKKNGPLNRTNPNEVRKKEGKKRKFGSVSPEDPKPSSTRNKDGHEESSKSAFSSKFMELLAAKSKHTNLVDARDADAQEEYFNVLEKKEKMEEKMLTTYKVDCKAVKCLKCRYTAFSASDMCKTRGHPLKVVDAMKRFFRCKDCNNRTVTLDLIPLLTCKQCGSSLWERAPMMKERKVSLHVNPLSIRGGEETFIGSLKSNGNMDLLVPE